MNKKNITDVIKEKIKRAESEFNLLKCRKHILVGLSGGADSCALLLMLLDLQNEYGYELSAVHVNHGIRGKEADSDENFSRNICESKNIRFFSEKINVPLMAEREGVSLETAARDARYRIFENICKCSRIDCVATAHTASDNVETIMFNLVRGCSLSGICGIPAKRRLGNTDVEIIRPLLYVSRKEVEEYLAYHEHGYVVDSTNLETEFSRNFIRHKIVPNLRELNPDIEQAVSSFVSCTVTDKEYLDSIAEKMFTDDIYKLSEMDYSVNSRIIRKMYSNQNTSEMLENVHIKSILSEIYACACGEKAHSSVSLPSKKHALIENGKICICDEVRNTENYNVEYNIELVSGINVIPGEKYIVIASYEMHDFQNCFEYNGNVYDKYDTVKVCTDKSCCKFTVRNRREGDTFFIRGMNRKVKKLLSDAEFSLDERKVIPFIADEDRIVYIPHIGVGDSYSVSKRTSDDIMNIAVYRIKKD